MFYRLLTRSIILVIVVTSLFVEVCSSQAVGVDWGNYHQKLMQYLLADKKNIDTSELRILDQAIMQELESKPAIQEAWPTLLALAQARRTLGYADSWTLLEKLRNSVTQQKLKAYFIETLAAEYLAIDLPWTALSLLDSISENLSSKGRDLRNRTEKIIDIIRADAAYVTPKINLYAGKTNIEKRLLDLLGIPPYAYVGSYLDLDLEAAVRRDEYGIGREIAALTTGTPVLTALLQQQPRLDIKKSLHLPETRRLQALALNEDQRRAAEQLIQKAPSNNSTSTIEPLLWQKFIPLILSNFEELLSESSFDWIMWRETKPHAKNLELVSAATFSDGVVLQFREPDEELTVFIVISSIETKEITTHAILWRGEGSASMRILDVDGIKGDEIVFLARVGSNHVFSLGVYNPHQSTLTMLARDVINGSATFLQLDDDPALEVIVSMATSEHRFNDCNQCPVRRLSIFYDFVPATASYEVRSVQRSGTDLSAQTVSNPFGWGSEFYLADSERKAAKAMDRLRQLSQPQTKNSINEDLHTLVEHAGLLIEADYFTIAADFLEKALNTIKSDSNDEEIESLRRTMTEMLLHALLNSHAVEKADQLLNEITIKKWAENNRDFAEYYYNTKLMTKLMLGDFNGAYQATQAGFTVSYAESASLHGNLAMYFTNIGEWKTAQRTALEALDLALFQEQQGNAARDLLLMATVAAATNQLEEATDWLARVIRFGNSSASPALSSTALVLAAEIAIQQRFVETAIQLLDAAIANMDEQFWYQIGARVMRIYGDAFHLMGQLDAADSAYAVAEQLGQSMAGSDLVAAIDRRAQIAEQKGDWVKAIAFSTQAFNLVLDGRSRVGLEAHKVSFIDMEKEIAEDHFRRLRRFGSEPAVLLEAIEAWRLQVFRDLYFGHQQRKNVDQIPLVQKVVGLLTADEAIVSFSIGEADAFAIVVTREGAKTVSLSLNAAAVTELVSQVRYWLDVTKPEPHTYINLGRIPQPLEEALRSLYDEIIAPLRLDQSIHTLIVSPDSALVGLPWGALLTPEQGTIDQLRAIMGRPLLHPLIERYSIAVLPSVLNLLKQLEDKAKEPGQERTQAVFIAALGSVPEVALDNSMPFLKTVGSLPRLDNGLAELKASSTALADKLSIVFLVDPATSRQPLLAGQVYPFVREELAAQLNHAAVLHITAHSLFNPQSPMESAVFLESAKGTEIIRARDFLDFHLDGVRLVVLAACETARSEVSTGAETFGFVRGLSGAGAHSIILTQWPVDDEATSTYFGAFYNKIQSLPLAVAAQKSALTVFAKRPHPFFWAAPTLYGWWR